jgi:hypothetical protein
LITERDLLEAIAECQGQRNPNATTCVKLASYYTILNQIKTSEQTGVTEVPKYSFAPPPVSNAITSLGDSEFSQAVEGKTIEEIWPVMEELMEVIKATNIGLYNGVIRKLKKLGEG